MGSKESREKKEFHQNEFNCHKPRNESFSHQQTNIPKYIPESYEGICQCCKRCYVHRRADKNYIKTYSVSKEKEPSQADYVKEKWSRQSLRSTDLNRKARNEYRVKDPINTHSIDNVRNRTSLKPNTQTQPPNTLIIRHSSHSQYDKNENSLKNSNEKFIRSTRYNYVPLRETETERNFRRHSLNLESSSGVQPNQSETPNKKIENPPPSITYDSSHTHLNNSKEYDTINKFKNPKKSNICHNSFDGSHPVCCSSSSCLLVCVRKSLFRPTQREETFSNPSYNHQLNQHEGQQMRLDDTSVYSSSSTPNSTVSAPSCYCKCCYACSSNAQRIKPRNTQVYASPTTHVSPNSSVKDQSIRQNRKSENHSICDFLCNALRKKSKDPPKTVIDKHQSAEPETIDKSNAFIPYCTCATFRVPFRSPRLQTKYETNKIIIDNDKELQKLHYITKEIEVRPETPSIGCSFHSPRMEIESKRSGSNSLGQQTKERTNTVPLDSAFNSTESKCEDAKLKNDSKSTTTVCRGRICYCHSSWPYDHPIWDKRPKTAHEFSTSLGRHEFINKKSSQMSPSSSEMSKTCSCDSSNYENRVEGVNSGLKTYEDRKSKKCQTTRKARTIRSSRFSECRSKPESMQSEIKPALTTHCFRAKGVAKKYDDGQRIQVQNSENSENFQPKLDNLRNDSTVPKYTYVYSAFHSPKYQPEPKKPFYICNVSNIDKNHKGTKSEKTQTLDISRKCKCEDKKTDNYQQNSSAGLPKYQTEQKVNNFTPLCPCINFGICRQTEYRKRPTSPHNTSVKQTDFSICQNVRKNKKTDVSPPSPPTPRNQCNKSFRKNLLASNPVYHSCSPRFYPIKCVTVKSETSCCSSQLSHDEE